MKFLVSRNFSHKPQIESISANFIFTDQVLFDLTNNTDDRRMISKRPIQQKIHLKRTITNVEIYKNYPCLQRAHFKNVLHIAIISKNDRL